MGDVCVVVVFIDGFVFVNQNSCDPPSTDVLFSIAYLFSSSLSLYMCLFPVSSTLSTHNVAKLPLALFLSLLGVTFVLWPPNQIVIPDF